MTALKPSYDASLGMLKALLLFGVVINHSWAAAQYISTAQIPPAAVWNWFSNAFIISGLPVFFFLSGYFAPADVENFFSGEYRAMLKKKFHGLFIPYLLWNGMFIVLYLAAARFFPRIGSRVESLGLESGMGILCSLLGIGRRPIDAPLWFIRDLMLIFLLLPPVNGLIRRLGWLIPGLLFAVGLGWPQIGMFYPNYYAVIAFCLGACCQRRKVNLHGLEKYAWLGLAALFVFSLAQFEFSMSGGTVKASPRRLCLFYLAAIPCWLAFLRWCHPAPGSWISRYAPPLSFFIYAGHFLVCSTFLHLLAPHIPDNHGKLALLYAIFLFCGGGGLFAAFYFLRRFTPRLLGCLIGGRV